MSSQKLDLALGNASFILRLPKPADPTLSNFSFRDFLKTQFMTGLKDPLEKKAKSHQHGNTGHKSRYAGLIAAGGSKMSPLLLSDWHSLKFFFSLLFDIFRL